MKPLRQRIIGLESNLASQKVIVLELCDKCGREREMNDHSDCQYHGSEQFNSAYKTILVSFI